MEITEQPTDHCMFSVSALVSWLRWLRWLGPDGGPKKSWITRRFLLICRDSHDGLW
jgi:hypothetical protein